MISHIEFCLEEIECEIEAQASSPGRGIPEEGCAELRQYIAAMRSLLADWRTEIEAPADSGDRLTLIRGIDEEVATRLAARGIVHFQTLADWRREDIEAIADETITFARISEENWIEQAAILAGGRLTSHARGIELAAIPDVEAIAPADAVLASTEAAVAATIPGAQAAEPPAAEATAAVAITEAPSAAVTSPVAAIAAAIELPATVPTGEADAAGTTAAAAAGNVVVLAPARRKGIGRRAAQIAAILAIAAGAAGVGLMQGWNLQDIVTITTAFASQAPSR